MCYPESERKIVRVWTLREDNIKKKEKKRKGKGKEALDRGRKGEARAKIEETSEEE
jgi:hypothetical protein